nr:MAG: hypothetical protein [Lokiarchaeota virus Skoll Meg22_1214]
MAHGILRKGKIHVFVPYLKNDLKEGYHLLSLNVWLRDRTCYRCGHLLDFSCFSQELFYLLMLKNQLIVNDDNFSISLIERLKKLIKKEIISIWNEQSIEILCCHCFNKMEEEENVF